MNVWIALRGATHALIQARLNHGKGAPDDAPVPPYNGPVADRHAALFSTMADREVVQGLFKKKGSGNAGYTLYSVNIPLGYDEDGNPDTSIIDDLQATYPGNQVLVIGAWDWRGIPFGMTEEMHEVEIGGELQYAPPEQAVDENGDLVWLPGDPILDENGDPVLDDNGVPMHEPDIPVMADPELIVDENGDPILTPIETVMQPTGNLLGTPVYADDTNLLAFCPDDVTYDQDGNETSRTPATSPKQVNVLAGQSARRFVKITGEPY